MKKIVSVKDSIDSINLAEDLISSILKMDFINPSKKEMYFRHISNYCYIIENILCYMIAKINSKIYYDYLELENDEENSAIDSIFREDIEYEKGLTDNIQSSLLSIIKIVNIISNTIIDHDWASATIIIDAMQASGNIIYFYSDQKSLSYIEATLAKNDISEKQYIDIENSLINSKLIIIKMQNKIYKNQLKLLSLFKHL